MPNGSSDLVCGPATTVEVYLCLSLRCGTPPNKKGVKCCSAFVESDKTGR